MLTTVKKVHRNPEVCIGPRPCWLVGPDVNRPLDPSSQTREPSYPEVSLSRGGCDVRFPGSWVILLKKAVELTAENFKSIIHVCLFVCLTGRAVRRS